MVFSRLELERANFRAWRLVIYSRPEFTPQILSFSIVHSVTRRCGRYWTVDFTYRETLGVRVRVADI